MEKKIEDFPKVAKKLSDLSTKEKLEFIRLICLLEAQIDIFPVGRDDKKEMPELRKIIAELKILLKNGCPDQNPDKAKAREAEENFQNKWLNFLRYKDFFKALLPVCEKYLQLT